MKGNHLTHLILGSNIYNIIAIFFSVLKSEPNNRMTTLPLHIGQISKGKLYQIIILFVKKLS